MDRELFFLEKAFRGWGIPAFLLDGQNNLALKACDEELDPNGEAVLVIREKFRQTDIPALWFEAPRILHMGFEDREGRLYLLGPLSIGELPEEQLRRYRHEHKWRNREMGICAVPLQQAVCCLSVIYALATGRYEQEEAIIEQAGIGISSEEEKEELWNIMADNSLFFSYEDETEYLEEFKRGDMRILDETILEGMWQLDHTAPVLRHNYLKQCEYAVVSAISITRRAAIESGLSEELCYRKSFEYMKRLSVCRTPLEMMYVYADVVNDLEERIRKKRENKNWGELQEQCKNYIARNIKRKFTVAEMAEELGYHPGYLSRVFSEREGITIRQYTLKERLQLAANFLVNSNVKIAMISDYLCFNSPSHMTEQFVKQYGITPTEYRRKNKVR